MDPNTNPTQPTPTEPVDAPPVVDSSSVQPVQAPEAPMPVTPAVPAAPAIETAALEPKPNKSYVKAVVLSYLFGTFGVDRFYLDKVLTGVIKLITLGGLGIWTLVDIIITVFGHAHVKGNDQPLEETEKYKPFFTKIFWIGVILAGAYIALMVLIMTLSLASYNRDRSRIDLQNQQLTQLEDGSNSDSNSSDDPYAKCDAIQDFDAWSACVDSVANSDSSTNSTTFQTN